MNRINVIGSGRVGAAVAARLRERGIAVDTDEPELFQGRDREAGDG